ncbi:MAG: hypothetical protein HKN41_01845 [Ilumatobacter sp.]|nr:hypothetical protein [Ilumatobacter sp.]
MLRRRACLFVAVATIATGSGVVAALPPIHGALTASERAERGIAFAPESSCDLATATAVGARHPAVDQLVLMVTDDFAATSGDVEILVRSADGTWRCRRGPQFAMFGRNGTRPLLARRSGDGTTPAGVFPLATVTAWDGGTFSMFGNRPDPGVLADYRPVRREDCWGATAGTARYQHVVERPGCAGPDEWLESYGEAYSHAAVIGANLDPISGDEPGETPYAAAIFLHRTSYRSSGAPKATSGCVSLGYEDLVDTLRSIDPALDPHFAIGPRDWLRNGTA